MNLGLSLAFLVSCWSPTNWVPVPAPGPPPLPVPGEISDFEEAPPAVAPAPLNDVDTALMAKVTNWALDAKTHVRHVQTDKPLYQPGDTIWIKSWHLTDVGLDPTKNGAVVYQLVGPRGGVVAEKRRVLQQDGTATNDIPLKSTSPGGRYHVRVIGTDGEPVEHEITVATYERPRINKTLEFVREAYGPGDVVQAAVSVESGTGKPLANRDLVATPVIDGVAMNPVTVSTDAQGEAFVAFELPYDMEAGAGLLTIKVTDGGLTESISRSIPIVVDSLDIELFPEGGDLLAGMDQRIYVQARNAWGEPADIYGHIVNDADEVVAAFETLHDGLGRFDLPSEWQNGHHIEVMEPAGVNAHLPMPTPVEDGCSLRHFDDFEGVQRALRVAIRCTHDRQVLLVATQDNAVFGSQTVQAGPNADAIAHLESIEPSLVTKEGVARVTLLNAEGVPLAERLVYRNRGAGLHVEITADRQDYQPRDEVTLTVRTTANDAPVSAQLAMSVVDDAVLSRADDKSGDIRFAATLAPVLGQSVHEPNNYWDEDAEHLGARLDMLMGTRGWRRFAWEQVWDPNAELVTGLDEAPDSAQAPLPFAETVPVDLSAVFAESNQLILGQPWQQRQGISPSDELLRQIIGTQGASGGNLSAFELGEVGGIGGSIADLGTGGGLGWSGIPATKKFDAKASLLGHEADLSTGDEDAIKRVVRRYTGQLKYCYERRLKTNPELAGRVQTALVITAGRVMSSRVQSNTTGDKELGACIASKTRRWRFPQDVEGDIMLSHEFSAEQVANDNPPLQLSQPKPMPKPVWTKVRVFPKPNYSASFAGTRTDFRETVLWAPKVVTNEQGEATVRFHLSDGVTSFRAKAEGVGAGRVGVGEATIRSERPFSLDAVLPTEVSALDVLQLPVRLSNNGGLPVDVTLEVATTGSLRLGDFERVVSLHSDAKESTFVPVTVGMSQGRASISVTGTAVGLSDHLQRDLSVVSRGFPRRQSRAGQLDTDVRHTLTLADPVEGSAELVVSLYPSSLASIADAAEGLMRTPSGCFEQASSRNYPNVMLLQFMQGAGISDARMALKAQTNLKTGYGKITGFETPSGGFEWWGKSPGHPALTSYGLLQLEDMKAVYAVEDEVIHRNAAWLYEQRDGSGGFTVPSDHHSFGRAPKDVVDAYIAWGMVESGATALEPELDAQAKQATATSDPYVLALATLSLLDGAQRRDAGQAAAARLASMQKSDGSWPSTTTITRSRGRAATVETTGLATLALLRSEGHQKAALAGSAWLQANRYGDGSWGTTQGTILALKALVALAQQTGFHRPEGTLTLLINGKPAGQRPLAATHRRTVTFNPDASLLVNGPNEVVLKQEGGALLPYAIGLTYRTSTPVSAKGAPIALTTHLDTPAAALGDTVRLTATATNSSSEAVPNVMATIGFPAGLEVQEWQLEEMLDRGEFAAVETQPREIIVYLRGMSANETRRWDFDLATRIPGTTTGPPSSARPYYQAEAVTWAPGEVIRVSP
jgi:alpha-2-macroglobulin-like protein